MDKTSPILSSSKAHPVSGHTGNGTAAQRNVGDVLTKHLQSTLHTATDIITAVYFLSRRRLDCLAMIRMYGGR